MDSHPLVEAELEVTQVCTIALRNILHLMLLGQRLEKMTSGSPSCPVVATVSLTSFSQVVAMPLPFEYGQAV